MILLPHLWRAHVLMCFLKNNPVSDQNRFDGTRIDLCMQKRIFNCDALVLYNSIMQEYVVNNLLFIQ